MANINDSHFGEGFSDSAKMSDKAKRKLESDIRKINKQKEKDLEKAERETDKSFVKSEKRRIRDLNKKIKENNGLVEENGYLVYRTKEKFKREKPDKGFHTPNTKLGRPFYHLFKFIRWLQDKISSFFASIFQRRKDVLYSDGTPLEGENISTKKPSPQQTVENDKDSPTISDPVKLLYTSPLSQENLLKAGTPTPEVDIVSEFRKFMEEQGKDADECKGDITYFLAMKLTTNQGISNQNLSDMAKYLTDYECTFDLETKSFMFTMHTADGKLAGVTVAENGEIYIPEYVAQGNSHIQNAIAKQPFENEKIEAFASFLAQNPNYINAIVTENLVSKTELSVVKAFIQDNPELSTMTEMVDIFESVNQREETYIMLNKTMARMTYIDDVAPETVFKYGFEEPSKVIPAMKNPMDYVVPLQAMQKYITEGMTFTNAAILSQAYLINQDKNAPILAITEQDKNALIDMHIHQLCQRGLPSTQIVNLIETYNDCADVRTMKIAMEQINAQLNNKTFVNDIIANKFPPSYSDQQIAEEIMKSMAEKSKEDLVSEFNSGKNSKLNAYIKALSFNDLIAVSAYMSGPAREEFNMLVSSTKGEPSRPDAGDMVLNEGSSFFMDDEEITNNNGGEIEVFRNLNDDQHLL